MLDVKILKRVNGKLAELSKEVKDTDEVTYVTISEKAGYAAYERSVVLMLLASVQKIAGNEVVTKTIVQYSVQNGLYLTIDGEMECKQEFLDQIKKEMKNLVERDLPIKKVSYSTDDAIRLFHDLGMHDKEQLFHYRRASRVNVYSLDGFQDYFYGYMARSTGCLKEFDLFPYDEGFVLVLPDRKTGKMPEKVEMAHKLFGVLKNSTKWGEKLNVRTVADLNDCIIKGKMKDLILVQEALQEREISNIAEQIAGNPDKKLIMIAGPSSSGKTSFSHRLSAQLRSLGLNPYPIPMDDYFVEREETPKDENGKYDYECLEAVDIKLFNRQMTELLEGKRVELPEFNFKEGKKEYKGKYLQLEEKDVLVIEGIHGLDDRLSYSLPKEKKFKIYISALTQLNIDEHNRIPTTDGRLLRRIVRDARTRGTSAKKTISMWPSVRRGEEQYIFPDQEGADAMFNSALIYELAVLKIYAESQLFGIGRDEPEYEEAKRLLKFLDYFVGIPNEYIPNNSLTREFIGGSIFPV